MRRGRRTGRTADRDVRVDSAGPARRRVAPTAPPSTRVAETRAGQILTRGAAADAATRGAVIIAKDIPREREDVRVIRGVARAPICPRRAPRPGALSASHHGEIRSFESCPSDRVENPPAEALRTPVEFRDGVRTATTASAARLRSTSRRSRIHLATRRRHEPPLAPTLLLVLVLVLISTRRLRASQSLPRPRVTRVPIRDPL